VCPDNAVDRVVTAATALFGADAAGLMLLDEHGQLHMVAAAGEQGRAAGEAEEQLAHGPCAEAFARWTPLAVADLDTDPRFRTTRATRSQDR
jgi:GAF domain-containing protein